MINKKRVANYVKNRNNSLSTQRVGQINIIFKDQFLNHIDYRTVFDKVGRLLPDHFLNLVDVIYVGDFDFLNKRSVNASYMDGAIYVSHIQDDEADLIDDIVHEFAHAVEEKYGHEIYSDGNIESNFISKRKRLRKLLNHDHYNTNPYDFSMTSFNQAFDDFIRKEIGYEKLHSYITGLFLGGYSTVSIREYFARGFEEFYLGDSLYLKLVCPYVYSKLILLDKEEEFEYGM